MKNWLKAWLLCCFLLSGMTALIYENVWEKFMSLFLGASAYSHAIVLGAFMLGLALGSYIFGQVVEKSRRPLHLYCWLEVGIGIYAVLFPWLVELGEWLYIHLQTAASPSYQTLGLKMLISLAIMTPPATLIGGTFPVMSKYLVCTHADRGRDLSRLYWINCLGAVLGCLLAGFYLIAVWGLVTTLQMAAAINLLIGISNFLLPHPRLELEMTPQGENVPSGSQPSFTPIQLTLLVVVAFLSGYTAMLYEVVWIKILSSVLGTSVYSFALMLAVFIFGLALGSWSISWYIDRLRNPIAILILFEFAIMIAIGVTLPIYDRLPFIFHYFSHSLVHNQMTYHLFVGFQAMLCALLMIPFCYFSGMILPLISVCFLSSMDRVGAKIGRIFAWNTLGTIIAALSTGLLLIPVIGTFNAVIVGLGINAGIIILMTYYSGQRDSRRWAYGLAAVSLLASIFLLVPKFNPHVYISSVFRHLTNMSFASYADFKDYYEHNYTILSHREGVTATVTVTQNSEGNRSLFINGKADASTGIDGDLITQTLLGFLPTVLKPNKKSALVIGIGTGNTAYMCALPATMERVDAVEISPDVVAALPLFADVNHDLIDNPKVAIHVEDAKTFLNLDRHGYDIIVSEPSNPWIAGIGNLFTRDFYQQIHRQLNPDGIFMQWVQAYETSDDIIISILATLRQVFPHLDIWYCAEKDILITCYKDAPLHLNAAASRDYFNQVKNEIAYTNLQNFEELLLMHVANESIVDLYLAPRSPRINTDLHPYIEYAAPKLLFLPATITSIDAMDQRLRSRSHSRYPFLPFFVNTTVDEYFSYFRHLFAVNPLTLRVRILEVMYQNQQLVETPWSRKYYLDDLAMLYDGAATPENRAWFLKELFKEYKKLVNCFIPVPFVPFLREKLEAYRADYPNDNDVGALYRELMASEADDIPRKE